jgi:hypothetical protein
LQRWSEYEKRAFDLSNGSSIALQAGDIQPNASNESSSVVISENQHRHGRLLEDSAFIQFAGTDFSSPKTTSTSVATHRELGLANSIWASPESPESTDSSAVIYSSLPAPVSSPWISTKQHHQRQVLIEYTVKVQKGDHNSRPRIPGLARLLKNIGVKQDLILELKQDNALVLCNTLSVNCTFNLKTNKSAILYKAADEIPNDSAWTIHFQIPFQAKKFYDVVAQNGLQISAKKVDGKRSIIARDYLHSRQAANLSALVHDNFTNIEEFNAVNREYIINNAKSSHARRVTYTFDELMKLRYRASKSQEGRLSDILIHLTQILPTHSKALIRDSPVRAVEPSRFPINSITYSQHAPHSISIALSGKLSKGVTPVIETPNFTQAVATGMDLPTTNTISKRTATKVWSAMPNKVKAIILGKSVDLPQNTKQAIPSFVKRENSLVTQGIPNTQYNKHISKSLDHERLLKTLESYHLNIEAETRVLSNTNSKAALCPSYIVPSPARDAPRFDLIQASIMDKLSPCSQISGLQSPTPITLTPPAAESPTVSTCSGAIESQYKYIPVTTLPTLVHSIPTLVTTLQPQVVETRSLAELLTDVPVVENTPPAILPKDFMPIITKAKRQSTELTNPQPDLFPPVVRPAIYANIHIATNANLRGMPGLGSSRWFTDDSVHSPDPSAIPLTPVDGYKHRRGASICPSKLPQAPILPNIPAVTPIFQTVGFQEPDGTYREVTGMIKAGSIPVIAQVPPPVLVQEYLGFTPAVLPTYTGQVRFPTQSNMYRQPISSEPNSSSQLFDKEDLVHASHPALFGRSVTARPTSSDRRTQTPVPHRKIVQAKSQSTLNSNCVGKSSFPQ